MVIDDVVVVAVFFSNVTVVILCDIVVVTVRRYELSSPSHFLGIFLAAELRTTRP